jgi:hypothetical protein
MTEFEDGYAKALSDVETYCEEMKVSFRHARLGPKDPENFPAAWFEGRASGYEEIAIHCRSANFFPSWGEQRSKLEIDGQT